MPFLQSLRKNNTTEPVKKTGFLWSLKAEAKNPLVEQPKSNPWNTPLKNNWTKTQPMSKAGTTTKNPLLRLDIPSGIDNAGSTQAVETKGNVFGAVGSAAKKVYDWQIEQNKKSEAKRLADQIKTLKENKESYRKLTGIDISKLSENQIQEEAKKVLAKKDKAMNLAMGATEPLKAVGGVGKALKGVKAIGKVDDVLAQEARKYKTAEEFVNSFVQHATDVPEKIRGGSIEKGMLASNVAEDIASKNPSYFYKTPDGKIFVGKNSGEIKSIFLVKKSDMQGLQTIGGVARGEGQLGLKPIAEFPVGTDIKSQLTDIWNQANKKPAGAGGVREAERKIISSTQEVRPSLLQQPLRQIAPKNLTDVRLSTSSQPKQAASAIERKTVAPTTEGPASRGVKILDSRGEKVDISLGNIIENFPTPVNRKVNILDYARTPENVLRKIGMSAQMDKLRAGYDAYIKELPVNIDKITEWSKQVNGKESNQKIFLHLDGQNVKLDPAELKVAGEIKVWLKGWADRLGLPEDKRITHYITHLFDDQFIKKEFDEDLAKIIAQKIPGSVYDPFLLKRLGAKGYKVDTWGALDAYVKRATRKVNLDPALKEIDDISPTLEKSQWDYLKNYVDRVNLRPTEFDSLIDNAIKSSPIGYKLGQRPTTAITRGLRQAGYRGGLWFNVGSALRNLSQGTNTYAVLGEKYTALGYAKLFSRANQKELVKEGVLSAGFIEDRVLSATKKAWQKADEAGFALFEGVERINRGAAYFGAKAKALKAGKTEAQAIEYGKKVVRQTQFAFGSIDTPVGMASDIVKTLVQFQTYNAKQIEFLAGLAKNKQWRSLARYAAMGTLYVYTIGQAFGMDIKELIPSLRMPAAPALKLGEEAGKAILGTPDKYGNERDIKQKLSDVGKTVWGVVPGGAQAKKTYQGTKAVLEGGSYDKAGRLQFKQGESLPEKTQSILFGKYAGQNAQKYFDNEVNTGDKLLDKALKEQKESKSDLTKQSEEAYAKLKTLPDKAQKKQFLLNLAKKNEPLVRKIIEMAKDDKLNLTYQDKMIKQLGVANGERGKYIKEKLKEFKTREEKKAWLLELARKGIVTKEVLKTIK